MTNNNTIPDPYAGDSPYHDQWREFLASTGDHKLTVLLDTTNSHGVFRSLRMARPRTGIWHWDLDTRPGYLQLTGDVCDGVTFGNHDADMLAWADRTGHRRYDDGARAIDMHYWAEKIRGVPANGRYGQADSSYTVTDTSATRALTDRFIENVVDDVLDEWDVEREYRQNDWVPGEGPIPDGSPWTLLTFAAACHHIYTDTILDLAIDEDDPPSAIPEQHLHNALMDNEALFGQYDFETNFTDISDDTVRACFAVEATVTAYRHHQVLVAALTGGMALPVFDVPGTTDIRVSLDRPVHHGADGELTRVTFTVTVPKGRSEGPNAYDLVQEYHVTWDRIEGLNPTYSRLIAGDTCDWFTPDRITTRGPLNPGTSRHSTIDIDLDDPGRTDDWPDISVVLASVGYFVETMVDRYRTFLAAE